MKTRRFPLLAAAVLLLLVGCAPATTPQPVQPLLPDAPLEFPAEFTFSSGAGAWATNLSLNADGTFVGDYHDSEMGLTGEGYPNGTVYICTFQGQFTDAQPINENSYRLTLDHVSVDERPEEEIRDKILYAAAGPHGLTVGDPESADLAREFILLTPETPVSTLDEELLFWWPGTFAATKSETLGCFALWNTDANIAFFTDPMN